MNKLTYFTVAAGSFLLMTAVTLGTVCLSFFVKPITDELGFDRGSFTLYYSLIFLTGIFTTPFLGRYIQKHGAKRVVLAGSLLCGLALALFSLASSLAAFYAIAVLFGLLFSGATFLAGSVTIHAWFVKMRGVMLGLTMSATGVGTAIFSLILPDFISRHGWRNGYLFLAACWLMLTMPAGLFLIRHEPRYYGQQAYGETETSGPASLSDAESGLTYVQAVRTPAMYLLMGSIFLVSMVVSNLQHLPSYLTAEGLTAIQLGSIMSVLSVMVAGAKIATGSISDRLGIGRTGLMVTLAGLIAYILLNLSSHYPILLVSMVFMALFNSSLSVLPPLTTAKLFGRQEFSAIWSVISLAGALGQVIGTPIWGLVHDRTGSYRPAFLATPLVIVAAFILLISAIRRLPDKNRPHKHP